MLTVFANSFMIASRAPVFERPEESGLRVDNESARTRRSREIAAFIAAARDGAHRQMNA